MAYKLFVVRVFVTDWDRALRFYTETLEIPTTYRSDELGWAQLDTGEAQLALERTDPSDEEARHFVGRFVGVSLQVSDIDATRRVVQKRARAIDLDHRIDQWMLDRLEESDRTIELLAGLRVLDGRLELPLRASAQIRRDGNEDRRPSSLEHRDSVPTDDVLRRNANAAEQDGRLIPGQIVDLVEV